MPPPSLTSLLRNDGLPCATAPHNGKLLLSYVFISCSVSFFLFPGLVWLGGRLEALSVCSFMGCSESVCLALLGLALMEVPSAQKKRELAVSLLSISGIC